jgi:hypothetical protein
MLDVVTGKAMCVVDLDTVMPGSALYDFGDMVRTTTSPTLEDELDLVEGPDAHADVQGARSRLSRKRGAVPHQGRAGAHRVLGQADHVHDRHPLSSPTSSAATPTSAFIVRTTTSTAPARSSNSSRASRSRRKRCRSSRTPCKERMTPGIFAKTFARPSVGEVFRAVAKLHLRAAHFNYACAGLPSLPDAIDPALADRVRKSAAEHRVSIVGVSGTFNMIHPRREAASGTACASWRSSREPASISGTGVGHALHRHARRREHVAASPGERFTGGVEGLAGLDDQGTDHRRQARGGSRRGAGGRQRGQLGASRSTAAGRDEVPAAEDRAGSGEPVSTPATWVAPKRFFDEAFDLLGADIAVAHAKELGADGHAGEPCAGEGRSRLGALRLRIAGGEVQRANRHARLSGSGTWSRV